MNQLIQNAFLILPFAFLGVSLDAAADEFATGKMAFYVYPHDVLKKASESVKAVRQHLQEIKRHVGSSSRFGTVGIAVVHPYTAFVVGEGPDKFRVQNHFPMLYDRVVQAAQAEAMPVMVCFNGAQWASVEGPYNEYWKLKDGGKYLSRYIDGKVNESIAATEFIKPDILRPFLSTGPYGDAKNALFLTHSPRASDLRTSRLKVLRLAAQMWKGICNSRKDAKVVFSTDSEVANFSFRRSQGRMIPLGYEKLLTDEFCRKHSVTDRNAFFARERIPYETDLEKRWFAFRADIHHAFVQDSVDAILGELGDVTIYTHQIPTLEGEYLSANGHDFASPQRTAFAKGSLPGFTIYVHGKVDAHVKKFAAEIGRKVGDGHWGAVEFNPGRSWKGTQRELADYTLALLRYLHRHGCRVVAPLSWESNALDQGIKDSGVDAGIKKYLLVGP